MYIYVCVYIFIFLLLYRAAAAALMMGEDLHKFGRSRLERHEFAMNGVNPASRQIYLTFPADSTFREEDVSSYFRFFYFFIFFCG